MPDPLYHSIAEDLREQIEFLESLRSAKFPADRNEFVVNVGEVGERLADPPSP
jgi:hypothetical protein